MRDSRGGADDLDRIFPPALMLLFIGVLAITPRSSLTTFLVTAGAAAAAAAGGCATSWTGVLAVSLEVGGPRLGRRRLSPNPVKETSSSLKEFLEVPGMRLASRTGVDIASKV